MRRKLEPKKPFVRIEDRRPAHSCDGDGYLSHLSLRVAGELAGGSGTGKTFAASRPAPVDDGATVLRGHAGQKTELADATLLGGLERSFHGRYLG